MPSSDLPGQGGTPPRPVNAPSAPTGAVVTPGVAGRVVATQVIIIGSGGELLVYSPTAGAGNLVASIAGAAGTDPYGNTFLAGIVSYVTIGSGAAAGSYALQVGQVTILGTPAPGIFINNLGNPAAIPPSVVAISSPSGSELVLGSGASTAGSTEAAVVVQDSTLSGLAAGVVNIVASQLQVNGTPVTVP